MVDRQWVISVMVVLVGLAAVIGVVLYLNTYFSALARREMRVSAGDRTEAGLPHSGPGTETE